MDSKSSRNYLPHLAWIIPSVIALLGIFLDHRDWASALLSNIWNLFFVNVWYIWCASAGYGLYRFVRLIQKLHDLTNNVIPTLMNRDADNMIRALGVIEKESKSRVSANEILTNRINSIDTQVHEHIKRGMTELQTKLSELIRKEAHERTDGINALQRELEKQFERMNKIESGAPGDRPVSAAELLATSKKIPSIGLLATIIESESKKHR